MTSSSSGWGIHYNFCCYDMQNHFKLYKDINKANDAKYIYLVINDPIFYLMSLLFLPNILFPTYFSRFSTLIQFYFLFSLILSLSHFSLIFFFYYFLFGVFFLMFCTFVLLSFIIGPKFTTNLSFMYAVAFVLINYRLFVLFMVFVN